MIIKSKGKVVSKNEIYELNKKLSEKSTEEVLDYFFKNFQNLAFSTSLAAEDQVVSDLIFKNSDKTRVFTLDTGRLHPETYDVMDATNIKYQTKIEVFLPNSKEVEKLYQSQGVNGHFESIEKRKTCCYIRKIEPLKRALKNVDVWITGLRSAQNITRSNTPLIEWDNVFNLIKLNPIISWSHEDVWNYIKQNNVPYNKLHDQGYPSIGCAPCTRAIKDGEDFRAGRWWWENPENKECGLHKK